MTWLKTKKKKDLDDGKIIEEMKMRQTKSAGSSSRLDVEEESEGMLDDDSSYHHTTQENKC